ncbi:MAG: proton-conducting transporter membrane subunit [Chloroflexota bacterium]|nr:proton-conducting transporter membrane subunit [Chloroflexota bacterium]
MENYPQLVPLIILIPAIGAFINFFWGMRIGEKGSAIIGTVAAALSFLVALALYAYLGSSGYEAAVVNPPLISGWITIPVANVEIPWQMRVDTLSVTMMLFVTGVGSLIHMYAMGYMHGDERFPRFFAYLNMFLAFMLILVTGNNLLMMFVGWEGVGLSSFLLIGFWWDKKNGVGWRNSNAARKAFIVNRIGDFGVLMAIFLTFWTFGTLDFYKPGELAVVGGHSEGDHSETAAGDADHSTEAGATDADHSETAATGVEGGAAAGEHSEGVVVDPNNPFAAAAAGLTTESAEAEAGVAEESAESEAEGTAFASLEFTDNTHIETRDLGIFGQAQRFLEEDVERTFHFGSVSLSIEGVLTLITLFMLLGATGKSAQIPLFIWLPDAMAGPTPVSALIHAATMVTAGVYMMVRSNVFFHDAELTSLITALIGTGTALVAGFIALGQWDVKRVLAYSTVSQLGFMVAAVGVGAYGAALFHVVTHAFFKALLFLGSGSVIHGMEHGHRHVHEHGSAHDDEHADAHDHGGEDEFDPQDMRNMGGLRSKMPITYITYLIGTLALAGIIPFAGFWSKDEILADAWIVGITENNLGGFLAFGGLLLAAGLTAFYMWRQVVMVFHGDPRTPAAEHASESGALMTIPLIVLAFFSLTIGFINTPANVLGLDGIFGAHRFSDWLGQTVLYAHAAEFQPLIAIGALLLAVGAIILAGSIYGKNKAVTADRRDPLALRTETAPFWSLANARLYWDQMYFRLFENPFNQVGKFLADRLDWAFWHDYFHDTIIGKGFNGIATLLAKPIDTGIIDGTVNGIGALVRWVSGNVRQVQTGYVRTYAITLLLGVVIVILVLLLPLINTNG